MIIRLAVLVMSECFDVNSIACTLIVDIEHLMWTKIFAPLHERSLFYWRLREVIDKLTGLMTSQASAHVDTVGAFNYILH